MTIVTITEVEPCGPRRLRIAFSNGQRGEVDLSAAIWGPIFELLKDPDFFAQVRISKHLGTIEWPNEAELAPEYVLAQMEQQKGGCLAVLADDPASSLQ